MISRETFHFLKLAEKYFDWCWQTTWNLVYSICCSHSKWRHSSVGQSIRFIPEVSPVRIQVPLPNKAQRLLRFLYGPLVKWLRHRPFTAVTWVRVPYGSPDLKQEIDTMCRSPVSFFYARKSLILQGFWSVDVSFEQAKAQDVVYLNSYLAAEHYMLRFSIVKSWRIVKLWRQSLNHDDQIVM